MGKSFDDDFEDNAGSDLLLKDSGEKIKESLEKILYQTTKHLCLNTGLSIGVILDWLDNNGDEVYGEQVGGLWVYYLAGNMPSRLKEPVKLYFGGSDGRTILSRPAPVSANTSTRRIGDLVVLPPPRPDYDKRSRNFSSLGDRRMGSQQLPPEDDDDDDSEKFVLQKIDPERLRVLAAENPDKAVIAEKLGIPKQRFRYEVSGQISLQKAYEKGESEFMEKEQTRTEKFGITAQIDAPTETQNKTNLPLKDRLTVEYLEDAGVRGLSIKKIADEMDVGFGSLQGCIYIKKNSELLEAWKRGKMRRAKSADGGSAKIQTNSGEELTAAAETVPSVAKDVQDAAKGQETATETSGEKILEEVSQLPDEQQPFQQTAIQTRSEKVEEIVQKHLMPSRATSFGGEVRFVGQAKPEGLNVTFGGDFFDLSARKRDILCAIAGLNDEFKREE